MNAKGYVPISSLSLMTACSQVVAPPPSSDTKIKLPNGSEVTMHCAPMIDYNGLSAKISGLQIPITPKGENIQVGAASVDAVPLQSTSALIQAMDIAQFNSRRAIPFVAPEDVFKVVQDANTQQQALARLLVNLNTAQNPEVAKAAVDAAADAAKTSAGAAANPPTPAPAASAPKSVPAIVPAATGAAGPKASAPGMAAASAGTATPGTVTAAPVVTPSKIVDDLSQSAKDLLAAAGAAKKNP